MRILYKTLGLAILSSGIFLAAGLARADLLLQIPQDPRELLPGETVEQELSAGQTHTYRIALVEGQYLRVIVEREIINVRVAISEPGGQQIILVGKNHPLRPETVSVVARESGDYLLTVSAPVPQNLSGRYKARIDELRDALPADEKRVAAEKAVAEGDQLRGRGTGDSLRKAIEKYEESLTNWRAIEDRNGEALVLGIIGLINRALGDSRKALDYYGQSLPLFRVSGDRLGESETLNNMATAHYALGDVQEAVDLFTHALPLQQEIGDRRGESSTLNNLGSVCLATGEPLLALDYYKRALPLRRALNNRRGEAITLNNIGTVYEGMGEFQRALNTYLEALPIRQESGDSRGEGVTLGNIGQIYHNLGEPEKSLDYFERALALRQAAGDRRGEGYTLRSIGLVYSSLGDQQKALTYIDRALSIFKEVGDRRGEAQTLNDSGSLYSELGDRQKAITYNTQALAACRATGDRNSEAQSLDGLGRIYAREGERDKSLDYYRSALAIRRDIKHPVGEAQTLMGMAEVEREAGNLVEACLLMESALAISESLRRRVATQELRASYFATNRDFYDSYIDLLMAMHRGQPSVGHDAQALEASERARARALLDSLVEARIDIRQGVDPSLLEKEKAIEQRLNAKESYRMRLLESKGSPEQLTKVGREIEDLLTEHQAIQSQLRSTSPAFVALTHPAPYSLADIRRKVLDPDTLLLEYTLGRNRSFLWAVTSNSIASFELPPRKHIETVARRAYELLIVSHRRQRKREGEIALAELGRILLGPVAERLGKKRLLIVADGALQYIPFAALPVPETRKSVSEIAASPRLPLSASYVPLIADHEIINLPSASVLGLLRTELVGRKPASRQVAVLADPVFRRDDLRVSQARAKLQKHNAENPAFRGVEGDLERAAKEIGLTGFERLPYSRLEADAIMAMSEKGGNLTVLDFSASREIATGSQLAEYRIVHFATHGLVNSRNPQLSGIVLSLVDAEGRPRQGFLRLHDIYNLKLGAELVVLSACRTALGKQIRGEGLVGLVRGFMYAGAPRVVASLWDVRDEATAEMMKRFYAKMLKEGMTAAAALRAAQAEMWREKRYEAPYYWAGFTIQGEWK